MNEETKIIVGYTVYWQDDDLLQSSLAVSEQIADRVNVVYGRFKGFDLPYIFPPEYLTNAGGRVHFYNSDNLLSQPRQRDLYLRGAKKDDIIVICDADWIFGPNIQKIRDVLEGLKHSDDWDACLLTMYKPDRSLEQRGIKIARYRPGMKHDNGQLLSINGKAIAAPDFRIKRIDPLEMRIVHFKMMDKQYRKAQAKYWEKNNKG